MNPELRTPIDTYLDAVDLALLKANTPRAGRTAIARDLESQILDMLRDRAAGREPTLVDVSAILATMDPPDAYAQSAGNPSAAAPVFHAPRRTLPGQIKWSALLCVAGVIGLGIVMGNYNPTRFRDPSDLMLFMLASTPVVLMLALGAIIGLAAFQTIRRNPTRYWGRPIALLGVVPFTLFLLGCSPVLFFTLLFTAILLFIAHRLWDLRPATERFLSSLE